MGAIELLRKVKEIRAEFTKVLKSAHFTAQQIDNLNNTDDALDITYYGCIIDQQLAVVEAKLMEIKDFREIKPAITGKRDLTP